MKNYTEYMCINIGIKYMYNVHIIVKKNVLFHNFKITFLFQSFL